MPYTSLNGHMFSQLTKENRVALRLPADARDAFLTKYKTTLCTQYGVVRKEYVLVPDALLAKTTELKRHFEASHAYVSSMKPKPTTRSKTATRTPVAKPRRAAATTTARTFKATIVRDGSMCAIPLTFDPQPVFGKIRVPVTVTLNGYTFRSTIATMGRSPWIPLRRSHREAARLRGDETLDVRLDLDTDARDVTLPADFVKALEAAAPAWDRWRELS
jgi:hypothetical protein